MSSTSEKRLLEREALRSVIQQWNANRLDLFELSEPNEDLEFHGVMRFYFQDSGQKVATKCIRVASDATVADVIETLIEKFRPDMRMLSVPSYALFELHSNLEERKLSPSEKPLLVQLNWHIDDREGRFLLRNIDHKTNVPAVGLTDMSNNFKRKLSKREKKELKKKEKLSRLQSDATNENQNAEKLYTELPETSFTRSISNPEAVMRRRRQQKLERRLQQFRAKDGGPDTGGTLKIYGESLCRDVPYKTLLLSIRDCSQAVVREMLSKYGLDKADPMHYCLVQVNGDGSEYILDDDECPLAILMNYPSTRGSIMFHVRRRPADLQPRRRKKKPLGTSNSNNTTSGGSGREGWGEGTVLVEVGAQGQPAEGGRRIKIGPEPVEVGSAATVALQLFGPMIQPRHCVVSIQENICTVTPIHPDALTFVNGHRIQQTTILHHGSVVMFGRVASFAYFDPIQDGRLSRHLALSQSQLDNTSVYDRSPTSPIPDHDHALEDDGSRSPMTLSQHEEYGSELIQSVLKNNTPNDQKSMTQDVTDFNKSDEYVKSNMVDTQQYKQDEYMAKAQEEQYNKGDSRENFETTFDLEGNVETKSICSAKSGGSNQDNRGGSFTRGQELILPAVLEFPEPPQELFLRHVITDLDVNAPTFKLAPVYTLYLCARYRASTHYRPELQPTERAHKLTLLLHHIANIIQGVIQERYADAKSLSFWMANSSELLHFLKSDRHISAFSIQAQDVLAECVQNAFRNLVSCFHVELSQMLGQFLSENIDHDSAAGLVLSVLGSAMALLRRCRVNAALTIQLFSQLFHYINVRCFNKVVSTPYMCNMVWGNRIQLRLSQLQQWAERQGLELAADCHLAKIVQCTHLLQAPKATPDDISSLTNACFKLNSLQMSALLSQCSEPHVPPQLIEQAVRNAESVADELMRADGREVRLEESPDLPLALLLPDDGFSCDVVKGVPAGLVDFLQPLQAANLCRLAIQPTSIGHWTVYMHQYHARSPSALSNKAPQPEIQVIKLHKNSNGMGLSIVAAKGAGQERLGIYIKSVVPGGAADLDQRLQAGDQLLRVDGQSLIGITQERAAEYLVRTGAVVTLEVAKQGAIYHGLATLLQQPSPLLHRGPRRMSERDLPSRVGAEGASHSGGSGKPPLPLPSSKSVPALHHVGSPSQENLMSPHGTSNAGLKSRSTHNLAGPISSTQEQGFYQNLSVYRSNNTSHPNLGERGSLLRTSQNSLQQKDPQPVTVTLPMQQRPSSAYFGNQPPVASQQAPNQSTPNLRAQSSKDIANFTRENQQQQSMRLNQNQSLTPSMPNISSNSQMLGHSHLGQIMSPHTHMHQSMSNISNLQQYNSNYGPNSPMLTPNSQHQHQYQPNQLISGGQMPQNDHLLSPANHMPQNVQMAANQRGIAKMAEMGEEVRRRQNRGPNQGPLSPNQQPRFLYGQEGSPYGLNKQQPNVAPKPQNKRPMHPDDAIHSPPLPPTSTHPLYRGAPIVPPHMSHNQPQPPMHQYSSGHHGMMPSPNAQNTNLGHGNTAQPGPNYSQHQGGSFPSPNASNPNYNTSSSMGNYGNQNIPPNTTGYTASMADPPRGNFYPTQGHGQQQQQHRGFGANNPWEREEREKEMEARREQARLWRDNQISELSSLPNRSPQQEEQLRALKLERDFQRRAQEAQIEEDTEQDKETSERVQGLLRLAHQQSNQLNQKVEPKLPQPVSSNVVSSITPISVVSTKTQDENNQKNLSTNQNYNQTQMAAENVNANINSAQNVAPKSILKQNLRLENLNSPISPSKQNKNTHFAENIITPTSLKFDSPNMNSVSSQHANVTQISKNMSNLNLTRSIDNLDTMNEYNQYNTPVRNDYNPKYEFNLIKAPEIVSPPPPPERNSSYQVMNQQNAIRNSVNSNVSVSSVSSSVNSVIENVTRSPVLSNANSNSMNNRDKRVSFHDGEPVPDSPSSPLDKEIIREDPNRFIMEAEDMLQSPQTPDGTVTNTPGVIGAQEVYRDPRQRMLMEQQRQAKASQPIPEKLSFKEKMKMFALESGENQTPRDKLKISRAQRDIDAVH